MSEWANYSIADMGLVVTGSTPSTKAKRFWDGEVPFYSPADFDGSILCTKTEKTVTEEALSFCRPIPVNAIMFTCIASVGKIAISSKCGVTNQQINSIIPFPDAFDYRFIYYILSYHRSIFENYAPQTTIPIINKGDFQKFSFIVPKDINEQRKIADILSTVDEVIEKTEAAIDKYQAIKAGMMQDLFTRGIDTRTGKLRPTIEEAPELYKESELGWIPKEWEIATLSEVCGMRSGDGITSKSIDEYGSYPVYGGNGLRGYTANYTHEGSYVLIGRQGALCGNVKRVDGIFYASEHAVVVSVNSDTNVDWMSYILESMNLNTYSEASAQPGLAVGKILCLRIRVPQLTEQSMIASVIQSLNTKIEAETALYSEYNKIKQGLMADLLTGTVKTV